MLEEKIIDLEIKITHQEELVNELNQVVTKQQFIIDDLGKDIAVLKLKLSASNGEGEVSIENEKPPHY